MTGNERGFQMNEAVAPERIALSVKPDFDAGEWEWCFASEVRALSGRVAALDREDAVVCAIGTAYDELVAANPVTVVVSLAENARLWGLVDDISAYYPGLTVTPFTGADTVLRAAAMRGLKPVHDVVIPAQSQRWCPPIAVATDGAARRGRIGWGWLAEDGQHACGSKQPPHEECGRRGHVVLAELRAISEAIGALPGRPLIIRSDSRAAIALVREWMQGGDRLPAGYAAAHYSAARRGGLGWMQQQVRREAHRIDICWVQGHAGDALNEGADSLAKLARRASEGTWGFTTDDVPDRAKAIAEVFTTAQRQLATAA